MKKLLITIGFALLGWESTKAGWNGLNIIDRWESFTLFQQIAVSAVSALAFGFIQFVTLMYWCVRCDAQIKGTISGWKENGGITIPQILWVLWSLPALAVIGLCKLGFGLVFGFMNLRVIK